MGLEGGGGGGVKADKQFYKSKATMIMTSEQETSQCCQCHMPVSTIRRFVVFGLTWYLKFKIE